MKEVLGADVRSSWGTGKVRKGGAMAPVVDVRRNIRVEGGGK